MPNRRRPEELIRDVAKSSKAQKAEADQRRNGISKTATIVGNKAIFGDNDGVSHPTDEQLDTINQFTRSKKQATDLVVFNTMSCNDLVDRDDDFFKTDCVKAFSKLPEPFSPVGKSFMVSHDYSKLPVGRIFGVGTEKVDVEAQKVQFLTNQVFMPNTAQYQDFIENMDFGIYWAVSVGVVLNGASCQVGKEHPWGWAPWFCSQGHEKGYSYDPDSDEEDAWGWPEPVEDDAKGAVRCVRAFEDPRDFYELSMCFLGAQYLAELSKDPSFDGHIKAASADKSVFAIGHEAASKLPILHAPERVKEAMHDQVKVSYDDDGRMIWVDSANMVWQYDTEAEEPEAVQCLGESKEPETPCKGATGQGVSDDAWDGSASRFSDDEYKASCAVCRGEDSEHPKQDCSLPHHEPGGQVNRSGVHAAAGRLDQTDLTDDQKSKAASHLSSHYTNDLDEDVPDSLKAIFDSAVAKAGHGSFDGTHSHEHSAYGSQGDDEMHTHSHTHNDDAVHDHAHDNEGGNSDGTNQDVAALEAGWAKIKAKREALTERIAAHKAEAPNDDEDEDPADMAQALDATLDAMRSAMDDEDYASASDLLTAAEAAVDELIELLGGTDADEPDEKTAGGPMSKKMVLAAVKAAGLPSSFYEAMANDEEAADFGLSAVMSHAAERIKSLEGEVQTLSPKASMGDAYLKDLKAQVRASFVRAYQREGEKVSTSAVDKLIKLADDDTDLLKELKDQYEEVVRQRFQRPTTAASAIPEDPNEHEDDAPQVSSMTLHSRVRVPGEKQAK